MGANAVFFLDKYRLFYANTETNTVKCGANTVLFWENTVVFWANKVVLWANVFGANTAVFGGNTVISAILPYKTWWKPRFLMN